MALCVAFFAFFRVHLIDLALSTARMALSEREPEREGIKEAEREGESRGQLYAPAWEMKFFFDKILQKKLQTTQSDMRKF